MARHRHGIVLGKSIVSMQQESLRRNENAIRVQRELMKEAVSLMLEKHYDDAEDLLIGYLREVGEL